MIRELETQGVVRKTHSPFNSPIWPVHKSDGEWRLTVDYHALNEVTPPLSAAVPDMLELQYELESKAAKWLHWNRVRLQSTYNTLMTPLCGGDTAMEVYEKGEKIIQILLEASFAIKKSKVKGYAQEIQFLAVK
ncbi:hypothetical protein DUI87_03055 [Hirundo rustica rustica]|uniref:Uncharacterized protein n=1 Tax=Hirundo rustica rustica TaxID=333673 RepID=A0A3M0L9A3_HIRRU|nr:hypothetical protein DUI87_03055 [Hirundo rustica rustica]